VSSRIKPFPHVSSFIGGKATKMHFFSNYVGNVINFIVH